MSSELWELGVSLRAVVTDELRTIEVDATAVGRVRVIPLNGWLRPLQIGLSLFLAFSGGS